MEAEVQVCASGQRAEVAFASQENTRTAGDRVQAVVPLSLIVKVVPRQQCNGEKVQDPGSYCLASHICEGVPDSRPSVWPERLGNKQLATSVVGAGTVFDFYLALAMQHEAKFVEQDADEVVRAAINRFGKAVRGGSEGMAHFLAY